jgi:arylsulfatase A-like enzyme
MKFHNAYSMAQCSTSRTTLLTGKYPWKTGWAKHWDVVMWGVGYFDWKRKENMTYARLMRDLGYSTCAVGKWQINDFRLEPECVKKHGFDDWCMWTGCEAKNTAAGHGYDDPYINKSGKNSRKHEGKYGPDCYTDYLIEFMEKNREKPLCMYYPMVLTHGPRHCTPDEPDAEEGLGQHKAMVRYTDKMVGKLVKAMNDIGIRDRTIIIFSTDNGSWRGAVGKRNGQTVHGGKGNKGEPGVCAPFIVNCPGLVPAGVETDALTDFTDLLPTFVELGGGTVPEDLDIDGVSIAPLILGRAKDSPREWIMSMGHDSMNRYSDGIRSSRPFETRVIRDKRYKVSVNYDKKLGRLIDLKNDPWEKRPIKKGSDGYDAVMAKFQAVLDSMPDRDRRMSYEPRAANAWDKKQKDK